MIPMPRVFVHNQLYFDTLHERLFDFVRRMRQSRRRNALSDPTRDVVTYTCPTRDFPFRMLLIDVYFDELA